MNQQRVWGKARPWRKYFGAVTIFSLWDFVSLSSFGLWIEKPNNLTAFGTTISGLVALTLAVLTLWTTNRQVRKEKEEARPNLLLTDLIVTQILFHRDEGGLFYIPSFRLNLTNLGDKSVLIKEIELVQNVNGLSWSRDINHLIKSGETSPLHPTIHLPRYLGPNGEVSGIISFYFYYAATGSIVHRKYVPYEGLIIEADVRKSSLKFFTEDQAWEEGVNLPSKPFNSR